MGRSHLLAQGAVSSIPTEAPTFAIRARRGMLLLARFTARDNNPRVSAARRPHQEEEVMSHISRSARHAVWVSTAVPATMLAYGSPSEARVTRIVIDATAPLAGQNVPYTQMR